VVNPFFPGHIQSLVIDAAWIGIHPGIFVLGVNQQIWLLPSAQVVITKSDDILTLVGSLHQPAGKDQLGLIRACRVYIKDGELPSANRDLSFRRADFILVAEGKYRARVFQGILGQDC